MLHLPPLPTWDALHPLVVHFPVALLFVAPLLVFCGVVIRPQRNGFYLAAGIVMLLGTIATHVAVSTGAAAAEVAERTPEINRVLDQHVAFAEKVRLAFTTLTIVWAALLALLHFGRQRIPTWATYSLPALFLGGYLWGLLFIAQMAHFGGRLVHQYGVHAMLPPEK